MNGHPTVCPTLDSATIRLRIRVRGAVQGVGFRPFVHQLATELELAGYVLNDGAGVELEVEGAETRVETFLVRLTTDAPRAARIQSCEPRWLQPAGHRTFAIRPSGAGPKTALILPDIAVCDDCLREMNDPADRRYRYPLINCTHCGPRFSIIEALPYDRPNTTMREFEMCEACRAEYEDPGDRRFHAQPTACPECGPRLELVNRSGGRDGEGDDALLAAAERVRRGEILALKGLGGFQLIVDARNEEAVARLRERKRRASKPLAVMAPSLEAARNWVELSGLEERLLAGAESPIVLLRRRGDEELASGIAPGNPWLGVMVPYTPLHHLLMAALGFPIVATSGNLSDEPICIDNDEARERLGGIADGFLMHDRPITRQVDDSVVAVMAGREVVLRRARGYAPLPITLGEPLPSVLTVGAHLKNTVAVTRGRDVMLSQHIGDLETPQALAAFRRAAGDLPRLYELRPEAVACDRHPDYESTRFALDLGLPVVAVQHHYAHALACMAENELPAPALALTWDGTGWGEDGTVWGGEALRIDEGGDWRRLARLRPFPLPGGEAAVREGRRAALGLLWAWRGAEAMELGELPPVAAFGKGQLRTLSSMMERGVNTPMTSSMGRLFDAVAAVAGICQVNRHEGQGAMALEWACADHEEGAYPWTIADEEEGETWTLDWGPMLDALLKDIAERVSLAIVAARFHHGLIALIQSIAERAGCPRVVLTGGCFQNRRLLEGAVTRLRERGFEPYWHQRVPPGDGSIALGQAVAAGLMMNSGEKEEPHVSGDTGSD